MRRRAGSHRFDALRLQRMTTPASDCVYVVQFIHPGKEHRPNATGCKPWNAGLHRRTFVEQRGRHVGSIKGKATKARLHFWCEWECQADLIRELDQESKDHPRFL